MIILSFKSDWIHVKIKLIQNKSKLMVRSVNKLKFNRAKINFFPKSDNPVPLPIKKLQELYYEE